MHKREVFLVRVEEKRMNHTLAHVVLVWASHALQRARPVPSFGRVNVTVNRRSILTHDRIQSQDGPSDTAKRMLLPVLAQDENEDSSTFLP